MAVPTYEAMMRPALELLEGRGALPFREISELVADSMDLSDAERSITIDSGQAVYVNRVGWAITYLVQAGAVTRPRRAVAEITDRGRELLRSVIGPISRKDLEQFEEFQAFRQRSRRTTRDEPTGPDDQDSSGLGPDRGSTPEETIARTVDTVHAALTGDLLDRIMELTPLAFETLVLRLLGAMKYGASGKIESTAATGDAGIDGVISQDPLGLDRIYVQAKRYDRDRTVGRPAMQAFVGALQGQQADRGVFMTTCRFTGEALEYADRVGVRIIPIDGDELARLMIKHAVGVQEGYVATLMKLDEDFFEEL
ncbi:restriction system protein mrr [Knoellia sinensis KCTC 19936]|uniref:Restriction system protein mrr n=1 Tax=Knoellia sinensis KCTC 19936 TaxID=1385520 RepID=A0A0A0J0R6_9MICO|nr:restriction endonuclease [Knoellia sinensis]KGN30314.1 restriction system protein mrr [Knoellia sinensis KCTC 19936]